MRHQHIVLETGAVQEPAPLGAFLRACADGLLHLGVAGSAVNALLSGMRRKSHRFQILYACKTLQTHQTPALCRRRAQVAPLQGVSDAFQERPICHKVPSELYLLCS
jgi:hypothetical protein